MSVTPIFRERAVTLPSVFAGIPPRVFHIDGPCDYCGLPADVRETVHYGEVQQWVGKEWDHGFHCTACHSREHNACEDCGKCLGDRELWGSGGYRSDRVFCGSACRQRAYRKRRRGGAA